MDQMMLAAVCRIIIGRNGRRIAAFPDIETAYMQGLFADYYTVYPHVTVKTLYKYIRGSTPYPHFLARHYGAPNGDRRTRSDMMGLVDACPSILLLRQIQDEVHQWVCGYLTLDEALSVCCHYVSQNATRRDIAIYLADMMHYAITHKLPASSDSTALHK